MKQYHTNIVSWQVGFSPAKKMFAKESKASSGYWSRATAIPLTQMY